MGKVTTQFQVDLSQWKPAVAAIKSDQQQIAALQAKLDNSKFDQRLGSMAPERQALAITKQIVQLREKLYSAGPPAERAVLQTQLAIVALESRRDAVAKSVWQTRQKTVALAQQEAAHQAKIAQQAELSAEAQRQSALAMELQGRGSSVRGSAGAGPMGRGGSAGYRAGMVSAQISDIAVQAQMGTQWATIVAQQGSQISAFFGPTGMIISGVVAIGAAMVSVGLKNKQLFDEMIKGATDAHDSLSTLATSGGLGEVEQALGRASEKATELAKAGRATAGLGTLLGQMVGGRSADSKSLAIKDAQLLVADDKIALQQRLVQLSDQELRIAKLRADGRDQEADAMKRQFDLVKRLAEINNLPVSLDVRTRLADNAKSAVRAQDDSERQKPIRDAENQKRETTAANTQKFLLAQKELARDRTGDYDGPEQIAVLERKLVMLRNEAVLGGLVLSEKEAARLAQSGQLDLAVKSLELLKEYESTQRSINNIAAQSRQKAAADAKSSFEKKQAVRATLLDIEQQLKIQDAVAKTGQEDSPEVAAQRRVLEVLQLQKQLRDSMKLDDKQAAQLAESIVASQERATAALKARKQQQASQELASDAAITHAKAHGHRVKAAKLQRQADVDERTKQIMESTGVPERAARAQAESMQKDIDKVDGARSVIRGATSTARSGLPDRTKPIASIFAPKDKATSPLDQHNRNNAANQSLTKSSNVKDSGLDAVLAVLRQIANELTAAN